MLQLMEADVVFGSEYRSMHNPGDPDPGIAALVKYGFDVEVLDNMPEYWGDEWYEWDWVRKVFIRARITIEIDEEAPDPQGDFLDWVGSIVEPFGGDPLEAGFADPRVRCRYWIARTGAIRIRTKAAPTEAGEKVMNRHDKKRLSSAEIHATMQALVDAGRLHANQEQDIRELCGQLLAICSDYPETAVRVLALLEALIVVAACSAPTPQNAKDTLKGVLERVERGVDAAWAVYRRKDS